jgi:UDP-N-acetyl-D-mannosaminuronate dehydrogenase
MCSHLESICDNDPAGTLNHKDVTVIHTEHSQIKNVTRKHMKQLNWYIIGTVYDGKKKKFVVDLRNESIYR